MAKILITGTSKGIGYDTALDLARSGHEVIATMRNPNASGLAEAAAKESLPMEIVRLDVDDADSVGAVFSEYAATLDVLVNNAGILSINAIEDEDFSKFQEVMNTNYFGVVRCTKAVLPAMREKQAGCIINISSIAGRIAFAPNAAYTASKFALEGFTEVLAQEMKLFGVRVALIEPGIISTSMATTGLPEYKADTVYPLGKRMHAMFENAAQTPAPADLVAARIKYVIESGTEIIRHPVGPDAAPFLGWRLTSSDEAFRDVFASRSDEEFKSQVRRHAMIELDPYL